MTFRRQPANPNPYPFASQPQQSQSPVDDPAASTAPPSATNSRKRARAASDVGDAAPVSGDPFQHENGSDASDASEDGGKPDKKAGRRKIKIEFIQDKSRRHITFSKRKAGIMKKAYELSTLTGTQVLLLVVSETGLVYTFTTAKLQPLVTQPEGKNLIQACLNAPHGSMPSSLPVGSPIGRTTMQGGSNSNSTRNNVPGGLAISGEKETDADAAGDDDNTQRGDDQQQQQQQHPDTRSTHARRPSASDAHSPTEKSPTQAARKPPAPPPPSAPAPNTANPGALSGGMPQYPYPGLGGVPIDPSMYQHPAHYMGGAAQGGYGTQGQGQGGQWAQQGGYARR